MGTFHGIPWVAEWITGNCLQNLFLKETLEKSDNVFIFIDGLYKTPENNLESCLFLLHTHTLLSAFQYPNADYSTGLTALQASTASLLLAHHIPTVKAGPVLTCWELGQSRIYDQKSTYYTGNCKRFSAQDFKGSCFCTTVTWNVFLNIRMYTWIHPWDLDIQQMDYEIWLVMALLSVLNHCQIHVLWHLWYNHIITSGNMKGYPAA